jgi:type IV secretion system protein VirB4
LNVLWRNIASPNVALWSHVIRRRECTIGHPASETGFAGHLEQRYRRHIAGETLMVNELYLSLVYRPASGVATSLAGKLLSRTHADGTRVDLADALDVCEKLAQTLEASLARYEPDLLNVYRHEGRAFSRPLEFFSYLATGEQQRAATLF